MAQVRRLIVALNFPKPIGQAIAYAKFIAGRMEGNAYFPSPTLPIATLSAHIAELDAAEAAVHTGLHGAATARDAKLVRVHDDLKQQRAYVQTVAGQRAEDAEAVVASSGMSIKRTAGPRKPLFSVKQLGTSGSVRLSVRHPGTTTSFDWQSSVDGVHWLDAARTTKASVDLHDLTPGSLYYFRYRTLTTHGLSDWSDPITLLVV